MQEVEVYWQKQQNRVLCYPLGDLRVTYIVHLWLVGKRVIEFLLVLIELFRQLSRLRHFEQILIKLVVFLKGVVHFEHKFQNFNDSWRQKTRVPGLSRGVVCVILCLAFLIQYQRVSDTHTHRHRQTDTR